MRLTGMTWNHTRGYLPVVATAQRFAELNPGVDIRWEKRSLQEFADAPLDALAERYDLLVIDHPWAGFAAAHHLLLRLDRHLPVAYLEEQARSSVGRSHTSYNFDGYQCALAIDAATPVAAYRPDAFLGAGRALPQTWTELLALAREGRVAFAGMPINALMDFFMLCATWGDPPGSRPEALVAPAVGARALEVLRALTALCPAEMTGWEPIALYEAMSTREDIWYCPFAYPYVNYARPGYARHPLRFTDLVTLEGAGRLVTTLGGTGLAVSSRCAHPEVALAYAMYTASPQVQRTLYFEAGGQPAHGAAWSDLAVNDRCGGFFRDTLPAYDRAYLRPRYAGYLGFQDRAGSLVAEFVRRGGHAPAVLLELDGLYRASRRAGGPGGAA